MALTSHGSSAITSDGSAGLTTTPTLARPAGTVNGDFLVMAASFPGSVSVTGVPSGWTEAFNGILGGNGERYVVYWKVANSEPGSWTWNVSAQIAFYNFAVVAIGGANATSPIVTFDTTSQTSSTGATISRTKTTTVPNEGLISVNISVPPSSGNDPSHAYNQGTEIFDSHGASATDMGIGINILDVPTPGTQTVTATVTWTGGSTAGLFMLQFEVYPTVITAGKSIVSPYGVRALAGRSIVQSWTLIAPATKALVQPYIVTTISGKSLALNYFTLPIVGRSLVWLYGVRALAGRTLEQRYGVGQAPPIPGLTNVDSYGDGASLTFGSAVPTSQDLSVFGTLSPAWRAPVETDIWYGRLPYELAQDVFLGRRATVVEATASSPVSESMFRARCSWHGTKLDPERGSFAVVKSGGPLADLVGERVRITTLRRSRKRSVVAYVVSESSYLLDDISLSRRLYSTLEALPSNFVEVRVEVLA